MFFKSYDLSDVEEPFTCTEVTYPLIWNGYQLRCRECRSERFLVVVERHGEASGELNWAKCPDGHIFGDPLIYPDFSHLLFRRAEIWALEGIEALPPLEEDLAVLPWRPHVMLCSEPLPQYGGRAATSWATWETQSKKYWLSREPRLVEAASRTEYAL
ncbi:hypothetical protein ABT340_15725 [Streptosporangium sp. NPDC000239]|uniref:hypothetical protein n=1 Tax=Streptosporangium sp. NPDC000239 TaxID=3154248 RepID=UPI003328C2B4